MSFNGISQYVPASGYLSQEIAHFTLGVLPVAQDPSGSSFSNSADLSADLSQQNVDTLTDFVVIDAPKPMDDLVADVFSTVVGKQESEEQNGLLLKSIEPPSPDKTTLSLQSDALEDVPNFEIF